MKKSATTTLKTPRRYASRGWTLIDTGGGCLALQRPLSDGREVLATAMPDGGVPHAHARVCVGIYGTAHSEPLEFVEVSYRGFLARPSLSWSVTLRLAADACVTCDEVSEGTECSRCGRVNCACGA